MFTSEIEEKVSKWLPKAVFAGVKSCFGERHKQSGRAAQAIWKYNTSNLAVRRKHCSVRKEAFLSCFSAYLYVIRLLFMRFGFYLQVADKGCG